MDPIETEGQVVPWFGTPLNFTDTVRMRMLRMRVGREHAERIAAWYMRMRDLAKQGRVFGTFTTNAVVFVESLGAPIVDSQEHPEAFLQWFVDLVELWQAFAAVGLIDIDGDPSQVDGTFRVTVLDFEETNWRRPSAPSGLSADVRGRGGRLTDEERRARDAERKRRERAAKKSPNAGMSSERPDASADVQMSAPIHTVDTGDTDGQQQHASGDAAPTPLPASPRSVAGQIRAAQRDLGSYVGSVIVGMIARRNGDRDRLLTERQEFDEYWRPACTLLEEHGPHRLRMAANRAGSENAVHIGFLRTICNSDQRVAAAAAERDPDLAQSDWAGYTGVTATAPNPGDAAA